MGMGDMFKNMGQMASLLKNENFRKLMANPKVQEVMKDPEVMGAMKSKNYHQLMNNPELKGLMEDPEVRDIFMKMNPKDLGL